jgi:cytochrome c biogenesis protein CcmG, thiol:disulfide interchange protein DsbE
MSSDANPSRARSRSSRQKGPIVIGLVVVVSLLFGLFVLPRIQPSEGARGAMAGDFSLPIVAGGDLGDRISLHDQLGKTVVLDFWATWCGPCAEQTKILERFAKGMDPAVRVIGINEGEPAAVLSAYFEQHSAAYPVVSDLDEFTGQRYGVRGLPTLVVIDKNGRISAVSSGVVPYARLVRLVAEASRER